MNKDFAQCDGYVYHCDYNLSSQYHVERLILIISDADGKDWTNLVFDTYDSWH